VENLPYREATGAQDGLLHVARTMKSWPVDIAQSGRPGYLIGGGSANKSVEREGLNARKGMRRSDAPSEWVSVTGSRREGPHPCPVASRRTHEIGRVTYYEQPGGRVRSFRARPGGACTASRAREAPRADSEVPVTPRRGDSALLKILSDLVMRELSLGWVSSGMPSGNGPAGRSARCVCCPRAPRRHEILSGPQGHWDEHLSLDYARYGLVKIASPTNEIRMPSICQSGPGMMRVKGEGWARPPGRPRWDGMRAGVSFRSRETERRGEAAWVVVELVTRFPDA
jgi:hypothetical protein